MKSHELAVLRFGDFVLVPSERLLLRDGRSLALAGRPFDLLVALVENAGHLLTKDEILARVWPGLVVEEVNLSVNISALRKVLAESPGGSTWIETVARQGYRFNAPVSVSDVATEDLAQLRGIGGSYAGAAPPAPIASRMGRRMWLWSLASLGGLGVALGLYRVLRPAEPYASVAVLPFGVDSASNAYVADGLVEGIIQSLTAVSSLRVLPRASAFRFKGAAADPASIGRKLEVAAVVSGAVRGEGESVKVSVEVFDVARDARAWGSTYEASPATFAPLHGRIRDDLARALRVNLPRRQGGPPVRAPSGNAAAYHAYLQARFLWNKRTEKALLEATGLFRRAIEMDPDFALAHAGLADAHTTLGYLGYAAPVSAFPVARPHALKALELDPTLAEAHAALGYIKFYFDWDWAGAGDEFKRALESNPNDPVSHQWHAVYLLAAGRPDEAFREVQAAHRLDPLSLAINTDIGFHHYYNARYPEAIAQLQSVLRMKDDFLLAHLWLGRTYLQVGRIEDALSEAAYADTRLRDWAVILAALGHAHGIAGNTQEARAVLRRLEELSTRRFVTAYGVALVHAGLRQKNEAFRWLERAFDERSHWLVWLRLDPRWKNIRGDPRFAAMVERMKYPA